jgi:hypothetical protein
VWTALFTFAWPIPRLTNWTAGPGTASLPTGAAKSDGQPYAIYPPFWVFANLYGQLGGGQVISVTTPSDLVVLGVRRDDVSPSRLTLWVTNPSETPYATTIQVTDFPTTTAHIEVLDNLSGNTPVEIKTSKGTPLIFEVVIPELSSYTVVVR